MKCPYKRECATVLYWSMEKGDFIRDICNTDAHYQCSHFMTLDAQHMDRLIYHGDSHAYKPDWNRVAMEAFLEGKYRGLGKFN